MLDEQEKNMAEEIRKLDFDFSLDYAAGFEFISKFIDGIVRKQYSKNRCVFEKFKSANGEELHQWVCFSENGKPMETLRVAYKNDRHNITEKDAEEFEMLKLKLKQKEP